MKRKLISIMLGLILLVGACLNAQAATGLQPRHCFTPYTFNFMLTETQWDIQSAKWKQADLNQIKNIPGMGANRPYWEFEARVSNAHLLWDLNTFTSTLPNNYYEIDTDDVSIGCSQMYNLAAEKAYNGYVKLYRAGPTIPSGKLFSWESEVGQWVAIDGWPLFYEQGINKNWNQRIPYDDITTKPMTSLSPLTADARFATTEVQAVEKFFIDSSSEALDVNTVIRSGDYDSKQKTYALISFAEYLATDEIDLLVGGAEIKEIYFFVPGSTGRSIASVVDNDVDDAVSRTIEHLRETGNDEMLSIANAYQNGDFGIFAAVVNADLTTLCTIESANQVDSAKLFYSAETERMAASNGIRVSYHCVPTKPDNTD